jgi:NADH dehydrogenase (ubiquinone) 1 alpha subcomplex subunit 5
MRFSTVLRAAHQATVAASSHIPRTKTTLPIVGLAVHQAPLPSLLHTYNSTLSLLQQIPASAVYRQSVESITKERADIVKQLGGKGSEDEIEAVEHRIGAGYIEEVLVQAEEEFALTAKMLEWKA